MGKWKVKQKRLGTYGTGYPTPITSDILKSNAYRVLTPTEKLILADMLRAYCSTSKWDSAPSPIGFIYTWSQCGEGVSERTFYESVKRVCTVGFFQYPPAIQSKQANAPKRYMQSTAWQGYTMSTTEKASIDRILSRKAAKMARDHTRRTAFAQELGKNRTSKIVREASSKIVREVNNVIQLPSSKIVREVTG